VVKIRWPIVSGTAAERVTLDADGLQAGYLPMLAAAGGSKINGEAMNYDNNDHEVWMRCFTAAIAAVLGAREAADDSDLESIVKYCGHIADAALDEERTRRPEPPRSGYQTLKPDVIR
jgi:hypothetical protein